MPRREPLETGKYYHVYNQSSHKLKIFGESESAIEFERALLYYLQAEPPAKFSIHERIKSRKDDFTKLQVSISSYCIMPTHFHLLLRQVVDGGISRYLNFLQNSFSHYYNRLHDSRGSVFQGRFKAKEIAIHTSRLYLSHYIHLNPYTAKLVTDINELGRYPHSSYKLFQQGTYPPGFDSKAILGHYLNESDYLLYLQDIEAAREPVPLIDDPGT